MIEKVVIHNFKIFGDLTVTFVDGMNTLTGMTDSGKSTVIQALEWCLTNTYFGSADSFRKWADSNRKSEYTKETHVTIHFSDGNVVRRYRSSTLNAYFLNDMESPFTSFKQDVPEEIEKVVKMSSINFQAQDDPKFLISMSPTECGKLLNKYLDLEDIQTANQYINSLQRQNATDISIAEAQIKQDEEELAEIKTKEPIYKLLDVYMSLQSDIEAKSIRRGLIDSLEASISYLRTCIKESKERLSILSYPIEDIRMLLSDIQDQENSRRQLDKKYSDAIVAIENKDKITNSRFVFVDGTLKDKWETIKEMTMNYDKLIKTVGTAIDVDVSIDVLRRHLKNSDLCIMVHEGVKYVVDFASKRLLLDKLMEDGKSSKQVYVDSKKELDKLAGEIDAVKKELNVCPTCGKEL